jgi:hypothetical protein
MGDFIVGSKMKSENGYGQNGYSGASSDTPGQKTTSGMLPQCDIEGAKAAEKQKRDINGSDAGKNLGQVPDHPGMKRLRPDGVTIVK